MRALVPIDGSSATYEALDRALDLLAGVPGLEITLLNVRQEGFESATDPQYIEETFEADEDDEVFPSEESSERALARAHSIVERHGRTAKSEILMGQYRKEILRLCGAHDVLVMHRLSTSSFKDALKGSGTEHLARRAACAVMLVD